MNKATVEAKEMACDDNSCKDDAMKCSETITTIDSGISLSTPKNQGSSLLMDRMSRQLENWQSHTTTINDSIARILESFHSLEAQNQEELKEKDDLDMEYQQILDDYNIIINKLNTELELSALRRDPSVDHANLSDELRKQRTLHLSSLGKHSVIKHARVDDKEARQHRRDANSASGLKSTRSEPDCKLEIDGDSGKGDTRMFLEENGDLRMKLKALQEETFVIEQCKSHIKKRILSMIKDLTMDESDALFTQSFIKSDDTHVLIQGLLSLRERFQDKLTALRNKVTEGKETIDKINKEMSVTQRNIQLIKYDSKVLRETVEAAQNNLDGVKKHEITLKQDIVPFQAEYERLRKDVRESQAMLKTLDSDVMKLEAERDAVRVAIAYENSLNENHATKENEKPTNRRKSRFLNWCRRKWN